MTIDDLLAIEDSTAFAIALCSLVFPRYDRDGFAALSAAEQVAYCIDSLEREVNNGGFAQFFENSSGDTTLETIAALEAIDAPALAELLRRAVAIFPDQVVPTDRETRLALIDGFPPSARSTWHALDGEFYDMAVDLPSLLRPYVLANQDGFRSE